MSFVFFASICVFFLNCAKKKYKKLKKKKKRQNKIADADDVHLYIEVLELLQSFGFSRYELNRTTTFPHQSVSRGCQLFTLKLCWGLILLHLLHYWSANISKLPVWLSTLRDGTGPVWSIKEINSKFSCLTHIFNVPPLTCERKQLSQKSYGSEHSVDLCRCHHKLHKCSAYKTYSSFILLIL